MAAENASTKSALAAGFGIGAKSAVMALGTSVQAAGLATQVGAKTALMAVETVGKTVNVTKKVTNAGLNAVGNVGEAGLKATGKLGSAAFKTTANVGTAALDATSVASTQLLASSGAVTAAAAKGTEEAAVAVATAAGKIAATAVTEGVGVGVKALEGVALVASTTATVATKTAANSVQGLGNLADLAALRGDAWVQKIKDEQSQNAKLRGKRAKEVLMIKLTEQFQVETETLYKAQTAVVEQQQTTLNLLVTVLKENYCLSKWRRVKSMFNSTKFCPPALYRQPVDMKLALHMRQYKTEANYFLQVFRQIQTNCISAMQLEGKKQQPGLTEEQELQSFLDLFQQKMAEFATKVQEEQVKLTDLYTKRNAQYQALQQKSYEGNFNSTGILTGGRSRKQRKHRKQKQKKTRKQ